MSAIDRPAELPAEPTPAELVRSVLAAARSLTLTTEGHRVDLVGLHTLRAPDRLLLTVPAESHLAQEIAATPEGALAAAVEFTDVAPVAVPDRIRARVRLDGRLSRAAEDPSAYRFAIASAALEHAGRTADVEPDELARAEPDPLAETEAEILAHLAGAHAGAVELLAQLVEPRLLAGVTRVDPLRLDRYGIVLRLQRVNGRHDVRLPFPTPLCNPAHGVVRLRTLLARARRCPRRSPR
jgi:hypothetical protein